MDYVVGFLFDNDLERVVLIRKNKPEWQAGKFNGVGGKVEPGDTCPEGSYFPAMEREFFEETGVDTAPGSGVLWSCFGVLRGGDFNVHVYAAKAPSRIIEAVKSTTDEEVVICHADLRDDQFELIDTVPNLQWLVPMCRNGLKDKNFLRAEIYYS